MNRFIDRFLPVFQMPDAPASPGATETPAASTSATPSEGAPEPTTQPDSPSDADLDFSAFFGSSGPEPTPAPTPGPGASPSEPTTPAQPTAQPAPAPAATPAAAPAPQAPTAQSPAAPAQPEATSPAAAQPPSLDPFDPGQLAQHLETNEQAVIQHVADNLLKLSPEDVEALENDVVGTVPKLLARVFVSNQKNMLMQMSRIIPAMIQKQQRVSQAQTEAENEFYRRWPDIKADNPEHKKLITQYGGVYRQMHPQATRQEMIEALGPMVMMAAKIVPSQQPAQQTRPAPMTPVNGIRPPQPAPFVPAAASAGGPAVSQPGEVNPWEQLFNGTSDT